MNKTLNILITGAGSTMAQSLFKALMMSKYAGKCNVAFTNSEAMGAAFFMAEEVSKAFIVPKAKDDGYIDKMIEICKNEKIDILFSGTEHEIFELAKAKKRFEDECNTLVMLSDIDVINIGTDKKLTGEFFEKNKLPFPKTKLFNKYKELVQEVGYPIFMKPRVASASRNIFIINSEEELFNNKFDIEENIIIQDYLKGEDEYTVEVFVDKDNNISGSIVMKRELQYGLSYWGVVEENKEAKIVAEAVAKALKPMGPVNIQLKIVDGKAIPFEINTRFSSTECIRANFGFNGVEAAIANYYYGEAVNLKVKEEGYFLRYWNECYVSKADVEKLIQNGKLNKESDR